MRHQGLQLAHRGQLVGGQPQVTDAAGIQRGVLELLSLQRWAAIGVEIDGDQHAAIGTADREADEQAFDDIGPDRGLLGLAGLAKRSSGRREQHMVGQGLPQQPQQPALLAAEHRACDERQLLGRAADMRRPRQSDQPSAIDSAITARLRTTIQLNAYSGMCVIV